MTGPADAHGRGYGQREPFGKQAQPPLLVHNEPGGRRPARQADGEAVAETKQLVVPARFQPAERKLGKIGVLFAQ